MDNDLSFLPVPFRWPSAPLNEQDLLEELGGVLAALGGVGGAGLYRLDAAGQFVLWAVGNGQAHPGPLPWGVPGSPEVAALHRGEELYRQGPPNTLCYPVRLGGRTLAALQLTFDGAVPSGLCAVLPWYSAYIASRLDSLERQQLTVADRREQALLSRILQTLEPGRGPDNLFRTVIHAVQDVLDVEHVAFGQVQGEQLVLREAAGPGCWHSHAPVGQGVVGRVIRTGVPALLEDVRCDPDFVSLHAGVQSELCVPVLEGGQVVAVLNVESQKRRLTPPDLRAVQALCHWLSRELERERLVAETERQRQALALLHQLRSAFDPAVDAGGAICAVTQGLGQTFGYSHVSVYLVRDDSLVLQHQVGYDWLIERIPLTAGVIGRCVRSGQQQWVQDMCSDPDAILAVEHVTSEVCAPLLRNGQVIGVLNVETVGTVPRLDSWDAQIIASVAGYLQQTLEAHWLRDQATQNEATYRLMAQHSSDIVCLHDANGLLTYVSPSVQTVLGYSPQQLCGRPFWRLMHPDDRRVWSQGQSAASPALCWRARHRDGHEVSMETTVSRIPGDQEAQYLSCSRDITEWQQVQDQLRWAASHDALTGLANRIKLSTHLEDALAHAQQGGAPDYAVLYLDMDRFKVINDSLGHAAGDDLLQAFADRLRGSTRPGDLVARLGGDEFAVLLRGLSLPDLTEVQAAAARLQDALTAPFVVLGHQVRVSVSIGIAPGELHYRSPAEILRDADLSMYRAKRDPQHSVVTYEPTMHVQAVRQLMLEEDLPHAAERGQLRVVYQPIVTLEDTALYAMEALARWDHPVLGAVPPQEFIALAEELGLIAALGETILEQACRTFQEVPGESVVQVNVSPRQFRGDCFVETVQRVLARTGLPARRLSLEITESALIDDVAEAARILDHLQRLGVGIQIDDFGTGYSSLAFLHRFPVDALKIDRAFIATLGQEPTSAKVVQTVLLLGQAMDVRVIAEGVETPRQREQLLRLGCRFGQGYLFSRPVSREDALEQLRRLEGLSDPAPDEVRP